jgi:hypothetical protein
MTHKIVRAAIEADKKGYKYMASVIKQVYNTVYWHVVPVESVVRAGEWPACPMQWHKGAVIPVGITRANWPDHTISRKDALALVD